VGGESSLDVLLELSHECVRSIHTRAESDKRLDHLATELVRHADDGRLGDVGVLAEDALRFAARARSSPSSDASGTTQRRESTWGSAKRLARA
jgi:hypothetical protein